MIVLHRFRVPENRSAEFEGLVRTLVADLAAKPGAESFDLVRNVDEPDLWALVARWADVGSYRRGIGGFDTKLAWVAVMEWIVDEPSAYADPADVAPNLPRETF